MNNFKKKVFFRRSKGDDLIRPFYNDADFIFSFVKLNESYTGDCIRIFRDSDNAELDVGFSGRLLDTQAIINFCGSDLGYIKGFYNQGTFRDSINPDNIAEWQGAGIGSLIFDGAQITVDNGKVCAHKKTLGILQGTGGYRYLYQNPFMAQNHMDFYVYRNSDEGTGGALLRWLWSENKESNHLQGVGSASDFRSNRVTFQWRPHGSAVSLQNPSVSVPDSLEQKTIFRNGNVNEIRILKGFINSHSRTENYTNDDDFLLSFFGGWIENGSRSTKGNFFELIIYKSYDETLRNNIEDDQINYYEL